MIIIYAILFASAGLSSSLIEASAIKGHAHTRPLEEGRSIKLTQVSNSLDKQAAKSAPVVQVPAAPSAPILESSKKIYNDESIRRLAQPQYVEQHQAAPVVDVASPVKVYEQQQSAKHASASPVAVVPSVPIVAAAPAKVEPEKVAPVESPMEPKMAPVVEPKKSVEPVPVVSVAAAPVKPAEELPQQSERSAQAVPVVEPSAAGAVVKQPESAPVQPEVVAVVPQQAAPVESVSVVKTESVLQAKRDEPVVQVVPAVPVPAQVDPLHIEVPAPDPALVLSDPIDSTTKLLIDLDEHVQKFLPAEDQQAAQPHKEPVLVAGIDYSPASAVDQTQGKSAPLVPYSSADEPIVPPLPSLDGVEKAAAPASGASPSSSSSSSVPSSVSSVSSPSTTRQGNNQNQNQQQVITQLLDQLDSLQNRIQDTINQLVARRRYVMSALLRPMGTYVRRVRTNLERLQTRVNQLQAAAVSVGGGSSTGNRPSGFVDAAAIETIRRRIDDISKRISDIVNRIRFSLTPTSAPLNSNGRK